MLASQRHVRFTLLLFFGGVPTSLDTIAECCWAISNATTMLSGGMEMEPRVLVLRVLVDNGVIGHYLRLLRECKAMGIKTLDPGWAGRQQKLALQCKSASEQADLEQAEERGSDPQQCGADSPDTPSDPWADPDIITKARKACKTMVDVLLEGLVKIAAAGRNEEDDDGEGRGSNAFLEKCKDGHCLPHTRTPP